MRLFAPLALACALGGCATTGSTHLTEGKALADAWSTFNGAVTTLDGLAVSGVLSASDKATIKQDVPKIEAALRAATAAYDASNDATAEQNVAAAVALTTDLLLIVKAHP